MCIRDRFKEIKDGFEHLALYQLEQPHSENWALHAKEHSWPQQAALIWLQAFPFYHLGQYQEAKQLVEQAQKAHDQFEALNQGELTADLLNDYHSVLHQLGDYQRSFEYCQKALNLRLKLLDENHPNVATSYANLSTCFACLGQYEKALNYSLQALDLRIKLFGEQHPHIADSYSNLSSCYQNLDQHNEALDYCQKALYLRIKLFGEQHKDVATSYNNLGSCYSDLGQYDSELTAR